MRAWLEALLPCFCRWILLSANIDKGNDKDGNCEKPTGKSLVLTLKHFLGAFGQPGIVVCFADRGERILKTLKNSARAVEAIGRGVVECHYWKRMTEATLGGRNDWAELAKLKDVPLELSQLDHLPIGWLKDAGDWTHIFSEVVSEEITPIFETMLKDTVCKKSNAKVYAGPAKTLSRSMAKSKEYMKEFEESMEDIRESKNDKRWKRFGKTFAKGFGRPPSNPNDFI